MENKKIISLDSILSGEAKIEELNLSARVHNVLMRSGVNTVLKLISLTEEELLHLENGHLKIEGVHEIESKILSLNISGLQIGMDNSNSDMMELMELKEFLKSVTELRNKCLKLKSDKKEDYLRIIDNLTLSVYESIENKKETNKKVK